MVAVIIEVTTSNRETLLWAPSAEEADALRSVLVAAGLTVLAADSQELNFFDRIPEGQSHLFDPDRILDVEIGGNAGAALDRVLSMGHELRWHPWQPDRNRGAVWGFAI